MKKNFFKIFFLFSIIFLGSFSVFASSLYTSTTNTYYYTNSTYAPFTLIQIGQFNVTTGGTANSATISLNGGGAGVQFILEPTSGGDSQGATAVPTHGCQTSVITVDNTTNLISYSLSPFGGGTCIFTTGQALNQYVYRTNSSDFFGYHGSGSTGETQLDLSTVSLAISLTVSKTGTGTGTLVSDPSGISCGSTCIQSPITSGTAYDIEAIPNAGSHFTSFTGCTSVVGMHCLITITASVSISADINLDTCFDGIKNQDETYPDYGGICTTLAGAGTLTITGLDVSGIGTHFITDFKVGGYIYIGGIRYIVSNINSDIYLQVHSSDWTSASPIEGTGFPTQGAGVYYYTSTLTPPMDCGTLGIDCFIVKAVKYLFVPPDFALVWLSNSWDSLSLHIPFSYLAVVTSTFTTLSTGSSTNVGTLSVSIGGHSLTYFSPILISSNPVASLIRTALSTALWVLLIFALYRRAITIFMIEEAK